MTPEGAPTHYLTKFSQKLIHPRFSLDPPLNFFVPAVVCVNRATESAQPILAKMYVPFHSFWRKQASFLSLTLATSNIKLSMKEWMIFSYTTTAVRFHNLCYFRNNNIFKSIFFVCVQIVLGLTIFRMGYSCKENLFLCCGAVGDGLARDMPVSFW